MSLPPSSPWSIGGPLPLLLGESFLATETGDEFWMAQALLAGLAGGGISNPNPSVGSVVVREGKLISRGATEAYGARHAERVACDSLSDELLAGATVFATLEPCSHHGQQPPCAGLLIEKKIKRVVFALGDPHPKVAGQGEARLRAAGIEVVTGVLSRAASLWHLPFLIQQHRPGPVLVGKWAETPAGVLASDSGESKWITSQRARAHSHWLRHRYDAVLVGAQTVLKDSPSLTVRDSPLSIRRQPLRIVLDMRGRIREITPELRKTTFSDEAPTVIIGSSHGTQPVGLPSQHYFFASPQSDPVTAVKEWAKSSDAAKVYGRPLQSIFIEGGAQVLNLFLAAKALDILHVYTGADKFTGTRHRVAIPEGYSSLGVHSLGEDRLTEFVLNRFAMIVGD